MVTEAKNPARALWVVGLAGACALGFALGQVCPRPTDAQIVRSLQKSAFGVDELKVQVAALREPARSPGVTAGGVDANELASKLQGIICENAKNLAATSRASVSPPNEAPPSQTRETEESLAPYHRVRGVVDDALRAKRWTDADRAELRRSTPRLSPAQDEEVTSALVQAINSGELTVKTSGPPL
jgi:hypothetical protein